jgi:hypothetical protein
MVTRRASARGRRLRKEQTELYPATMSRSKGGSWPHRKSRFAGLHSTAVELVLGLERFGSSVTVMELAEAVGVRIKAFLECDFDDLSAAVSKNLVV